MKKYRSVVGALSVLALGLSGVGLAWGQQGPAEGGAPIHLVVTVEPHHGSEAPAVNRDDVMVFEGKARDTVTEWIPAQGDRAALELFVLLDDGSNASIGLQLDEVRKFMNAQPASTKIGVAYMQNGIAKIMQAPTDDHALSGKALRLPMGIRGTNGSPYFALSDLAKRWPASTARREILLISDGIDLYYGAGNLDDPYLSAAIDDLQRAGIEVSAIYSPGAGHFGHSYWQTYWGQLYLAQVADQTGGEAYDIGFAGPPVTFAPYLDDLSQRLTHQYFLTFIAKPQKKAGWQKIKLRTEVSSVDLVSADKVYVPAEPR